jgi:dephospho-CoA kinase
MTRGKKRSVTVVGLAGGIASGKSLVASMLAELGARVLNADEINHEVLQEPAIVREVVANWGEEVLNERGELDRRELADKVFGDEREVKKLEGILHPEVLKRIMAAIAEEEARGGVGVVVIDAPLLFEAGLAEECDRTVFIEAPEEARLERVKRDRKWDSKELSRRERHQKPLSFKRGHADVVLMNGGSTGELRKQVERLWQDLARGKSQ